MQRFNISLLIIVMLLGTVSKVQPAWADGPYRGKVIDAETKEPIEGAVAVAVWMRRIFNPIQGQTGFAEVKEAITDKNGEFVIPGYKWTSIFFTYGVRPPRIFIFSPGYGFFPEYQISPNPKQSNAALLEPFKTHALVELPKLKTKEERIKVYNSYDLGISIPHEKTPNYMRTKNFERKELGFAGEEE
jgi:hypothetical protein